MMTEVTVLTTGGKVTVKVDSEVTVWVVGTSTVVGSTTVVGVMRVVVMGTLDVTTASESDMAVVVVVLSTVVGVVI